MGRILISGLINMETTVRVRQFPINYYPIDYPFFGVKTAVSGVGYNIAKALTTLGDEVRLCTMTGKDFPAEFIRSELESLGISQEGVKQKLRETPASVVLYEETGRRQIHCDLKDMQETGYDFPADICGDADIVVATNTNFNRELLWKAKAAGKIIATDVHVLSNIYDDYNRDFMQCADILFLSDEGIGEDYWGFLMALEREYGTKILVLGRGSKGAAMYVKDGDRFIDLPAVQLGDVVNTVGAGDALFSGFVHYYAQGRDAEEALKLAQVFAAAKIRANGAAQGFVTEEELERLYGICYG